MPSPAQARGTLVHAVLERLFLLPAEQRTPQAAARSWRRPGRSCAPTIPAAAALSAPRPGPPMTRPDDWPAHGLAIRPADQDPADETASRRRWLASSAEPLLDAYFALEDPRLLEPEARELLVEVELESGLLLRGYIDRVDVDAAPDGATIRVVDYKTGRRRAPSPRRARCSR